MQLVRLILINIKKQLKSPTMIIMTLILPIVMILAINSDSFGGKSSSDIGIIDKNNSSYSQKLIEKLEEEYEVLKLENDTEDNYDLLRENEIGAIYIIGEDFDSMLESGEVPKIICYKTENPIGLVVADNSIEDYVTSVLEENISEGLSSNYIKTEIIEQENSSEKNLYKMVAIMLCYFMMLGSSFISAEILKLKEQKVLRRSISTSNSDAVILGSIYISAFLIQGALTAISYSILSFILKLPMEKLLEGILIVFLGSLITTSIIVVITRYVKNISIASLIIPVLDLMLFGIAMMNDMMSSFENIPSIIAKISVLSPFTWLLKIMDTGEIFIPIIIIVLMSTVLFTAGSFKLREYVKE